MKERGIIFTGPSIPAILEDRKTHDCRVMNPQPDYSLLKPGTVLEAHKCPELGPSHAGRTEWGLYGRPYNPSDVPCFGFNCPFGVPGDRFWVRETWGIGDSNGRLVDPCLNYRADGRQVPFERHGPDWCVNGQCVFEEDLVRIPSGWRSPRFMYRWASRITRELTDVRLQQVQDISEEVVLAEGIQRQTCDGAGQVWYGIGASVDPNLSRVGPIGAFACRWDSLNAHRGHPWENNDWVWALTFRRVTTDH